MDADLIISVVVLALVALIGANTWLILTVRDRVGKVDRRIEGQNQRLTNILEYLAELIAFHPLVSEDFLIL